MPSPKQLSFFDFQRRFPGEQACREFLFKARWPDGFVCPRCQGRHHTFVSTRNLWECSGCDYQASLIAGTLFQGTRLPLTTWFWAVYLLATQSKSLSILQLQKDLGIGSYKTAWRITHAIRLAMAQEAREDWLEGLLQLDDAYVGGAKQGGKSGRGAPGKKAVVVLAQPGTKKKPGKVAFAVGEQVDRQLVRTVVERHVHGKATVVSDALASNRAAAGVEGVRHEAVSSSADPLGAWAELATVHRHIANAKRFLVGTHHAIGLQNAEVFLGEFAWRFNRRYERKAPLGLLSRLVHTPPRPLQTLLGEQGVAGLLR
jgi:hypothetical protein